MCEIMFSNEQHKFLLWKQARMPVLDYFSLKSTEMKQDDQFDRNEAGQSIRQKWSRTINSTEMKQDDHFDRNEAGQ